MKFTFATKSLLLASSLITTTAAVNTGLLRATATTQDEESSCNKAPDQATCAQAVDDATGLPCEWCLAGAIPSECMSQEQAKILPPGVFDCSLPSSASASSSAQRKTHFDFEQATLRLSVKEATADDGFCDPASKSISGYMDISGSNYDKDGEDKHLFFWMFEKRGSFDENTPFIVWLTGGPGCSSTLALLTENGPCSVNPDGETTTVNPSSWTEAAHMLWLDQPAGVGFSYGQETDSNEAMIAEDAYWFFQAFFQAYPEYANNPLYIVGESYAGHYVPSISHRIYQGNQAISAAENVQKSTIHLNYAGLAIGNGLTAPEKQYPAYPEMVYNNSHGIRVVDETTYKAMKEAVPRCTQLIHQCNAGDGFINDFACQSAFLVCNMALTSPYQMTGLNPYDIRKKCEKPPLCYDFSHVQKFLNSPDTKRALHVDEKHSHAWQSCNYGINMKFHTDWMKDFSGYVAELLEAGYPALIYVGDVDFICNYIGNKAWTYDLEWSGKSAFQAAEEHEWKSTGKARTANGFTFLQVYDAGHMVPADQPENSLDMITNFVAGGKF